MRRQPFAYGTRVRTAMGVRRTGVVIPPFVIRGASDLDGTYREPHDHERTRVVYARWEDGTRGWAYRDHIEAV